MDDFDKIVEAAWNAPLDDFLKDLDAIADAFFNEGGPEEFFRDLMEGWEEGDPAPTFVIYSPDTGLPDKCHLCGKSDDWVCKGNYFSCEHGIVWTPLAPLLAQSSRPIRKMVRKPELTGRFRLQRLDPFGEEEDISTWEQRL